LNSIAAGGPARPEAAIAGVDEMQHSQRGIALVEAILAIVLLGIVVVTALGRFDDMADGTTAAAVYKNVGARISSAAAVNYTARILDPSAIVALQSGGDCTSGLYSAAFPSDFDAADPGIADPELNCR
jgi:Tfp pilus assembly protein FimT